jgi:hypothetical protein
MALIHGTQEFLTSTPKSMGKHNKQTMLNQRSPLTLGLDKNEILHFDLEDSDVDDDLLGEHESSNGSHGIIFTPKVKLPQLISRPRSVQNLVNLIDNGAIDICPEYQRSVVWTKDRQSGLIDSLMENYYVPPIIFNKKSGPKQMLVCVDGKQRLSSIKAFIEGSIPCRDAKSRPWYFRPPKSNQDGKKRSKRSINILPHHIKKQFTQKILVCCEIADLSPTQEEDLFSRVQLGIPLSSAEKMRAKSGPWNDLAKLFEQDFEEVVGLSGTERARGFQNLLICFAQINEVQNHTSKESVPKFRSNWRTLEKFAHESSTLTQARRSHLAKVFTVFKELVSQDIQTFKDNGYKRSKNFAPVEMVAVAVLISQYGDAMGSEELLQLIRTMRRTARQQALDLFTNKVTWEIFWRYIQEVGVERGDILEKRRSHDVEAFNHDSLDSSEEENERAILEQFKPRKSMEAQTKHSHTTTPSLKRKRSSDFAPDQLAKVASLSAIPALDSVSGSTPKFTQDLIEDLSIPTEGTTQDANADGIHSDAQSTSSGYSSHPETRRRSVWDNPPPTKTHQFFAEECDQILSPSPPPIPLVGDATADGVHHPAHNYASVVTTEQTQDHQSPLDHSNGIQVGTSKSWQELPS